MDSASMKTKMMKEFQTYINQMTKDMMAKYEASLDSMISSMSGEAVDAPVSESETAKPEPVKKKSPAKKPASPKKAAPKKEEEKISIPFEESQADIVGAKKDQLAAWCKKYGLKSTGKVDELVSRLMDYKKEHPPVGGEVEEETVTKSAPIKSLVKGGLLAIGGDGSKAASKKKPASAPVQSALMKKFLGNAPVYRTQRNKFGNFEDPNTKLLFDKDDKVVIGRQDPSGAILELTDEDIEICKQYKFNYRLPENLDVHKKGLKHVKVDEVDEDLNEDDIGDFSDDGAEEGEEDQFDEE
jgi:hypothetical protein